MNWIKNRITSFKNAFRGVFVFILKYGGAHIYIHLLAAALAISAGIYLNITNADWAALTIVIVLVISAEMFNSSIELIVDMVQPEWDEKAGIIKDIAAGAVLICSLGALVTGYFIFIDEIVHLITGNVI